MCVIQRSREQTYYEDKRVIDTTAIRDPDFSGSETEKRESTRKKAMGKKKAGGANNDDQNAELKQATLAGRRAHRFPP